MSAPDKSMPNPYGAFSGSPQWATIDRAIRELAENRDLIETTQHEYVVGFLCKALAESTEPVPTPAMSRLEALNRLRSAVKLANVENRDLVEELIQERRVEALHD
jgi:hypothetical protein